MANVRSEAEVNGQGIKSRLSKWDRGFGPSSYRPQYLIDDLLNFSEQASWP
jgi:hypothetical protein